MIARGKFQGRECASTTRRRIATVLAVGLLASGLVACGGGGDVAAGDVGPTDSASPAPTGPPVRAAGPLQEELVRGTGKVPPIDPAELRDLQQLAKQTGEDLEVLKARHRGQSQFGILANRFAFGQQEIWVSGGVARDGEPGDYWLVFTRRPPAKVFARLRQLETDTNVMFGAPATAREIRRLSNAVLSSLSGHQGVFSEIGTGTDRHGASATITYSVDPAATPQPTRADLDRYRAESLAAGAARFKDGTMPVPVEFVEAPPGGRELVDKAQ